MINMVTLINAVWMLIFGGVAVFVAGRKRGPGRLSLLLFLGLFGIAGYLLGGNLPIMRYSGELISMLYNLSDQASAHNFGVALKAIAMGALAIPALVMALAIAVSLLCRVPISTGVVRAFKGLGVPVACVLFLFYAVTLPLTVREEIQTKRDIQKMIQHEGHYFAELTSRPWPQE
jgi:hypothetical protein